MAYPVNDPNASAPPPHKPAKRRRRFRRACLVGAVLLLVAGVASLIPGWRQILISHGLRESMLPQRVVIDPPEGPSMRMIGSCNDDEATIRLLITIRGEAIQPSLGLAILAFDKIGRVHDFVGYHPIIEKADPHGIRHPFARWISRVQMAVEEKTEGFHILRGQMEGVYFQATTRPVQWRKIGAALEPIQALRELSIVVPGSSPTPGDTHFFDSVASLRHLEKLVLYLNQPGVDDTQVAVLAGCPSLRELTLRGGGFTAEGLLALKACATLEQLDIIGGTPDLSEAEIRKIHAAMPKVRLAVNPPAP